MTEKHTQLFETTFTEDVDGMPLGVEMRPIGGALRDVDTTPSGGIVGWVVPDEEGETHE